MTDQKFLIEDGHTTINVELATDLVAVDEVVVIAYRYSHQNLHIQVRQKL
jgi:hypothetical protein